jgi:cytosine/adenosine deaminase-related metal-dependent hydrolase
MIDAHAHFFESSRPGTNPMSMNLSRWFPYKSEVSWMKRRIGVTLAQYLCSGVTSVAVMGAIPWEYEVQALAESSTHAPRLVMAAGPISNAGPPLSPEMKSSWGDLPVETLDRSESAGPLLDRLTRRRVDLVKAFVNPVNLVDFTPALTELVRQSHVRGYRVATHALQLAAAKTALRAGTDILAHTVVDAPLDEEFLRLAVERGATTISTIGYIPAAARLADRAFSLEEPEKTCGDPEIEASWRTWEAIPESERPPIDPRLRRAGDIRTTILENVRRLHVAGIPIAAGTDAGNVGSQHGPSFQTELRLLNQAGLNPMDVIVAATRDAARALARDKDLGTLQVGKLADLIVLDRDPLQDVVNVDSVVEVVTHGRIITRDELRRRIAAKSRVSN